MFPSNVTLAYLHLLPVLFLEVVVEGAVLVPSAGSLYLMKRNSALKNIYVTFFLTTFT